MRWTCVTIPLLSLVKWLSIHPKGSAPGVDEFCVDGRLAPRFFLLGAQKSSTTSFYFDLILSPGIVAPRLESGAEWKELMFFDNATRFSQGRQFWLSHYPRCDLARHAVSIDCSTTYLLTPSVAERIASIYGDRKARLLFLVLLREPLARAQSSWYHHKAKARFAQTESFQSFVREFLVTGVDKEHVIEASLYAKQLQRYFSVFNASQFIIAPYRWYTESRGQSGSVIELVWDGLRVPRAARWSLKRLLYAEHKRSVNVHAHPLPHEDLDAASFAALHSHLEQRTGPQSVARVLAGSGARLYGYSGALDDEDAISAWLSSGW